MLDEYTVVYKQRSPNGSFEDRVMPLKEYCSMLRVNIIKILSDMERIKENCHDDEYWKGEGAQMMRTIRNKVLDSANAVDRMPTHMRHKGVRLDAMSGGEFIAGVFDSAERKK